MAEPFFILQSSLDDYNAKKQREADFFAQAARAAAPKADASGTNNPGNNDILGHKPHWIKQPITADQCEIVWDDKSVGTAINFTLEYSQQLSRRRSLGSRDVVGLSSLPQGRATMAQFITTEGNVTNTKSWTCETGEMTFSLGTCSGPGGPAGTGRFHASGCLVTQFTITAHAEELTVLENVTIEFFELKNE